MRPLRFRILKTSPLIVLVHMSALSIVPARRTAACIGTPPGTCGKSLVLAKASPGVVLNAPGEPVTVTLPLLIFLGATEFPPGIGFCPQPPFPASITLTASCPPLPDVTVTVPTSLQAGFNNVPVTITFPPGPARICSVVGTVTATCPASNATPQGLTLSATGDTFVCLVDPVPGDPSVPILDLRHSEPTESIIRTHPGDQAVFTYTLTNNHPTDAFSGQVVADMHNVARMPTSSDPSFVYSISNPSQGDDFPINFVENLGSACVTRPVDPTTSILPTITKSVTLPPGESMEIKVAARSWPFCAPGSSGETTVVVRGTLGDGGSTGTAEAVACAGGVLAIDTSVPPSGCCPTDNAQVALLAPNANPPAGNPGTRSYDLADLFNNEGVTVTTTTSVEATSNGTPVRGDTFESSGPLGDSNTGRSETSITPIDPLLPGDTITVSTTMDMELLDSPGTVSSTAFSIEEFDPVFVVDIPLNASLTGMVTLTGSNVLDDVATLDYQIRSQARFDGFDISTFEQFSMPMNVDSVQTTISPNRMSVSYEVTGLVPGTDTSEIFGVTITDDLRITALKDGPGPDCPDPLPGELPRPTITEFTLSESDGGLAQINVPFVFPPGGPFTADFSYTTKSDPADTATEGEDFVPTGGTITALREMPDSTIPVPVIDDSIPEDDETLSVSITNEDTGSTFDLNVTIIDDDDEPPVGVIFPTINDVTQPETDGGIASFDFEMTLAHELIHAVGIDVATRDGTATAGEDYERVDKRITIPPGETSATISVPVFGDTVLEMDETFFVDLTLPDGSSVSATGTILDDDGIVDRPPVDFAAVGLAVEEVTPGVLGIAPIMQVSTQGLNSFPIEADLLVDGMVIMEYRGSSIGVNAIGNRCIAEDLDACNGECKVRLVRGEESNLFDGSCGVTPPAGCVCTSMEALLQESEVPLSPGSEVTLALDPNDVVPETDETNNAFGFLVGAPPPRLLGDADGDGDVDLGDFLVLLVCIGEPDVPANRVCEVFDLDGDSDVDLADFVEFQEAVTGRR